MGDAEALKLPWKDGKPSSDLSDPAGGYWITLETFPENCLQLSGGRGCQPLVPVSKSRICG